ncbi:MAG: CBS domain-containing protein [Thermoplasmata archaeon]
MAPGCRAMVLRVQEIMHRDFVSVPPEADVLTCVNEMVRRREGFVLVIDGGRAWGMATEWDFMEKVLAPGRDPRRVRIGEIATRPVKSVRADTPTVDVVEEMSQRGIRRMMITEGDRTVGVVTAKDVFRVFRAYMDRISSDIAKLQSTTL